MSDEQKAVNVLGVGECGTQVAMELAAGYELGAVQEMILPYLPRKGNFTFRLFRRSNDKIERPGQAPHFFIGDFNRNNINYIRAKCLTLLSKICTEQPGDTDEKIIRRYNSDSEGKSLGLPDEVVKEILKKLRKNGLTPQFDVLDFYSGNQLVLAPQGAGGYQYLSEALTNANSALVERIGQVPSRMLFGIFGLGGGSGAGSAFALLSNDPLRGSRVNLGIGILPSSSEGSFWRNSGRFICRYLSADTSQRFTSLTCVSNRAADLAGSLREQNGEANSDHRERTIRDHINRYISQFVYYLSLANSQDITAIRGKAFDTSDLKRYLGPITAFGFSERSFEGVNFEEMFVRAISPMRIEDDHICGLSCAVLAEAERVTELTDRLRKHFKNTSRSGAQVATEIHEVAKLTGFYRTVKRIWVFFFVSDRAADNEVMRSQERIASRLQNLTGSKTDLIISTYVNPSIKKDALLLIVDGGVSLDLADAVEAYVNSAFLNADPSQTNRFKRLFREHLARIRESERLEDQERIKSGFMEAWHAFFPEDVTKEKPDENELEYMRSHKFVPEEIRSPDRNPYLLTTGKVMSACVQLLQMSAAFKLPEPEVDSGDDLPPPP